MQFDGAPNLEAYVEALGEELQELFGAFDDLKTKRWIDTGEGAQLDGIGRLVNQGRQITKEVQPIYFGFRTQPHTAGFGKAPMRRAGSHSSMLASSNLSDIQYRLLLWAKVWKNHAKGTAEDTIRSVKFIFQAPEVRLDEKGDAHISIGIGKLLTREEIQVAKAVDLFVRMGGVQIDDFTQYSEKDYFGFLGQPHSVGFEQGPFADLFTF